MPELSRAEKLAGRLFRDACREALAGRNAGIRTPTWVRYYRHECEAQRQLSTTIYLAEHYVTSPEYWVCYCSVVGENGYYTGGHDFPHRDCDGGRKLLEAGFFVFFWKEGKCRACERVLCSSDGGGFAIASQRPVLHGAVGEEFHEFAGSHVRWVSA